MNFDTPPAVQQRLSVTQPQLITPVVQQQLQVLQGQAIPTVNMYYLFTSGLAPNADTSPIQQHPYVVALPYFPQLLLQIPNYTNIIGPVSSDAPVMGGPEHTAQLPFLFPRATISWPFSFFS